MKKIYFILLLVSFGLSNLYGQTITRKRGFVSFHYGRYGVLSESFVRYYGTRFGSYYGGSLGVPLTENLSLYGKASYFQKEGIPIYEPTGLREGSAVLKQGIVELGVQINYLLVPQIHLIVASGVSIAAIDEERFAPNGSFTFETEGNGDFGIFVDTALEINLGESPFSIVNEINYLYSWKPFLTYENTYQSLYFTTGVRFYFGG